MPHSEISRKLLHIGVGAGAFLLRWLTWWQAAIFALLGIIFNLLILPRVAPRFFRPGDLAPGRLSGIALYPMVVLGLILCFPSRLEIAAAAWAILAAGDGCATIAGITLPSRRVSWNPRKSVAGLIAFIVAGSAAGVAVAAWTMLGRHEVAPWWIVVAPIVAAVVAGLVETLPLRLDDNITVVAMSALVLWSLSLTDADVWRASSGVLTARWPLAVGLNGLVAFLGWRARTVTPGGALVGAVIGVAIYVGADWRGWALLMVAFVTAVASTRAGRERKRIAGIAEEREGRRGPGNALANTGLAAWAAIIALGMARRDLAELAMATALITALSDTVASEIGKAWGRRTWLVTRLTRVAPGTSGAVSLEGTLAGVVAAATLATLAWALGLIAPAAIAVVVVAATVASFIEGVLGATLEGEGYLDNDALNFVNGLIGAALAIAIVTVGP